ncbi:MAG: hypothetical protein AB1762_14545 [Gemmatimonadota bacterium]
MHPITVASMNIAAARPSDAVAVIRRTLALAHRFFNAVVILAVVAQYYTIGLVMFGVTGLTLHRSIGSVTLIGGLLSFLTALGAGRVLARPLAALGILGLLLLQPALAFGLRGAAPAFAALHAVNGLLILGLAVRMHLRGPTRM